MLSPVSACNMICMRLAMEILVGFRLCPRADGQIKTCRPREALRVSIFFFFF